MNVNGASGRCVCVRAVCCVAMFDVARLYAFATVRVCMFDIKRKVHSIQPRHSAPI